MTCGLPINDAALRLGVHRRTLTSWIEHGAPVVRQGRPGRGKPTLVDPDAVRAWRGQPAAPAAPGPSLAELGELMGAAALDLLEATPQPDRRTIARALGLLLVCTLGSVADHLGQPELSPNEMPDALRRLSRAARV